MKPDCTQDPIPGKGTGGTRPCPALGKPDGELSCRHPAARNGSRVPLACFSPMASSTPTPKVEARPQPTVAPPVQVPWWREWLKPIAGRHARRVCHCRGREHWTQRAEPDLEAAEVCHHAGLAQIELTQLVGPLCQIGLAMVFRWRRNAATSR